MNLENIKSGDKIIISYKNKQYISFVEQLIEGEQILFQNIYEYDNEFKLKIDDFYNITIFSEDKEIKLYIKILSYLDEGRRRFYLAHIDKNYSISLNNKMRRKNVRYACDLPYNISVITKDNQNVNCIIKDIGFGGIRIITNNILEESDKIYINFDNNIDFFTAKGNVIHCQYYPKSNYKNQYRIQFFETDFSDKDFFKKYFLEKSLDSFRK